MSTTSFLIGFEYSQALFFIPPSAFPFPLFTSRVSMDFPVVSLWFLIGVWGMTLRVSLFWLPAAVSLISSTCFRCTTAFGCSWGSSSADGQSLSSSLPSSDVASAPLSCAVGCFRAASLCSTLFLSKGVSTFWWISSVAWRNRFCCSLFSFCSVGRCCSSSFCSDGKPSWKVCLLWYLLQKCCLGTTVSSWCHRTLSWSQEYPLLQRPHSKGG